MDYERLQAKCRTQEKEIERLRSEVRAMTEILIDLHASGVLSEGQVAKATGLDRVQIRALADGEVAEGYETEKDNA
jgi:acyl CoA:acetate/3-ketoacid CoA transferase alpha subunit